MSTLEDAIAEAIWTRVGDPAPNSRRTQGITGKALAAVRECVRSDPVRTLQQLGIDASEGEYAYGMGGYWHLQTSTEDTT